MTKKYAHLNADRDVIGFYNDEWHAGAIPADAVAISDDVHAELIAGQAAGKVMKLRKNGKAHLAERPAPTADELAASLRAQRSGALADTDWMVARHQDEVLAGDETSLSSDQFKALSAYRRALRDITKSDSFPNVNLPAAPDFVGVQR